MNDHTDPPLSEEQVIRISILSADELNLIDSYFLGRCTGKWRKVAAIVGEVMIDDINNIKNIPDAFLADMIYKSESILENFGGIVWASRIDVLGPQN